MNAYKEACLTLLLYFSSIKVKLVTLPSTRKKKREEAEDTAAPACLYDESAGHERSELPDAENN